MSGAQQYSRHAGSWRSEYFRVVPEHPQDQLEYTAPNWDPPSRWDDGITGALFDYNFNAQTTDRKGSRNDNLNGNGTVGFNQGAWRFRGDWQSQMQRSAGQASQQQFAWSRFYALRAIPSLRSSLIVGEGYLDSDLFGSFRYTGANLSSNDNMLPPNLRGYAPEVTGVARTNARVVISQQGRVLYNTQVPPGPFVSRTLTMRSVVSWMCASKNRTAVFRISQWTPPAFRI